jgi:outer membrane protein OmpA-like peptidoglycan-associated protein
MDTKLLAVRAADVRVFWLLGILFTLFGSESVVAQPGKIQGWENLGENINTKYDEYAPVISPDGRTLYFVRDGHPHNKGGEDIWYSKRKIGSNAWEKAKNMPAPLNNADNNAVLSVSADGDRLLLMGEYTKGRTFPHELSISTIKANKTSWSIPKKIVFEPFERQNSTRESYYLQQDERTLLMSINMGGKKTQNFGQNDIYVSFKQKNGVWSAPKNLGSTINTNGFEYSPFLAADGVTLFFSSDGHPNGLGSNDVYMSKRLDDTWTNWSKPENLGPTINSKDFDTDFTIPASGEYGYLTSDRSGFGGSDIFKVKLPEHLRPNPTVLVYGKVLDKDTRLPVQAEISWENTSGKKDKGEVVFDPELSDYMFILPLSKTVYNLRADASGYGELNDTLDLNRYKGYAEIQKNFYVSVPKPQPTPQPSNSPQPEPPKEPEWYVLGQSYDAKTRQPLKAKITFKIAEQLDTEGHTLSQATGNYRLKVPKAVQYYLNASADGYFPASDRFSFEDFKNGFELRKDLFLEPIEIGRKITLRNIFFDFDKWTLRPESSDELDRVVQILNELPSLTLEIGGHTDSKGSDAFNLTLSQNRAKAVVDYLVSKGIKAERLKAQGYGESQPVATNETDEGRQENRRVEVKITGN